MAQPAPRPYGRAMSRLIPLCIALAVSLASAPTAAPAHKRPARAHNYGFLPGYHQPLNNAAPLFKQEASVLRNARRPKRPWYITPTPVYYRWYDGEKRYFGQPGFYRGQYNGGSMGPCYTQTPIGPVWNCGR